MKQPNDAWVSLRLPQKTLERFDSEAERYGVKRSQLVRFVLTWATNHIDFRNLRNEMRRGTAE